MAARKTTTTSKAAQKKRVEEEAVVVEMTQPAVVEQPKPQPKKFKDEDQIPCVSISSGEVLYVGEKSKILYDWVSFGDVVEMEYRDLLIALRTKRPCVMKPRVIVQDAEFLKQNPQLEELYNGLYSPADIRAILLLPADKLKDAIAVLPIGAQDALKGIASAEIDEGVLDSVAKVKVLDEIFGTQLTLKMMN